MMNYHPLRVPVFSSLYILHIDRDIIPLHADLCHASADKRHHPTYFGVCVLSLIPYILDSFKKMPKRKGKEPDYDDDELQESKSCQIR